MIQKKVMLDKNIRVVIVSDLHIGLKGFRPDIMNDIINEIKKPNTYWIGLGDFIEGREPSHKFYDDKEVTMSVGEQYEYFFNAFRPYMRKCIGLHPGNHEDSLIQRTTINPIAQFCTDNKVTYLGAVARTVFDNGDKTISMITTHGAGGGTQVGGPINKAISYAKVFNANLVCIGHHHKLVHTCELHSSEDEEGKLHWSPMHIVLNGSALESYRDGDLGCYAEKKMMHPNALGYAVINISQKELDINVDLKPY